MNCDVTISKADWKTLHNTLCELRSIHMDMHTSVVKVDRIESVIRGFEAALRDAYDQDNASFTMKMDHYSEIQKAEGLRSIWSIFSVDELGEQHPFLDAEKVIYRDHWGDKTVSETIPGGTWIDLYIAADRCIRASGDDHHIFIESFRPSKDDPKTLILSTGS
jgi:hypothetical protein